MSSQCLIFPNENGTLSMGAIPSDGDWDLLISRVVPPETYYAVVDVSDLPTQYSVFCDAWVFSTPPEVVVDLAKAKVIYKQIADSQAANLSKPLTQEYMRLLAVGGDTTVVQAQLQAINAAAEETAYLDAESVDALIACWPPELGPNPFLPTVAE